MPKVKICGNTNAQDVLQLIRFPVDALGFTITERRIPSRIDPGLAAKFIRLVPPHILTVVGVGAYPVERMVEICRETSPDVLQLQRSGGIGELVGIRSAVPGIKLWKGF